ncbi:hypothetical protein GCM10009867_13450 [Pedococcus aerophilus]|uniref:Uncharacterized protein n=1 Tax=Pedococcus aerophilus TaxID=436356 RepID=A0ABN3UJN5_9MICO
MLCVPLCFTGGLVQYRSGLVPEAFLGAPVLGLRAGGDVLVGMDVVWSTTPRTGAGYCVIHLSALLEELRLVLRAWPGAEVPVGTQVMLSPGAACGAGSRR